MIWKDAETNEETLFRGNWNESDHYNHKYQGTLNNNYQTL